ncbi:tetratricopeptide repeat protein [Streptomyces sp. WAC04189]|uniref:Tetratricopeptide repeat protein n=1 Tax=Streptomyces rochei TaxID=1928 RepID=A0AAX3ZM47_STRRO|nr:MULTISPECIES: tetratricopeptide repeat protein [Streptomyces]RSS06293.1 tetratricopeptide repeat protein [Streptomyces sp. WAC04189]WMC87930.1 tetratricopeptide repeat protein [Streptomyces rochei]
MSRLGRDRQRGREDAERPPGPAAAPIDVRVPADASAGSGASSASVDGALVVAAPGEEIQNAVLDRLHRLAVAAGHPVHATIHDERIGCSVPLRIDPDGSSHLAGDPTPAAPVRQDRATAPTTPVRQDRATHVLRAVEPARDGTPTFRLSPVAEPRPTPVAGDSAPTFTLRTLPGAAPGTVAPPTGEFGPPPRMDAGTANDGTANDDVVNEGSGSGGGAAAGAADTSAETSEGERRDEAATGTTAGGTPAARRPLLVVPDTDPDPDPKRTPTPARGFDAVAEAVLGDGPVTAPGDATAPALLAEPTGRINEAVKEGRTQEAARLAEQTVTDASGTLGPEHPEVLRLRELTAYIAYLSGDPGRAFRLSLELARIHRRAGDAEAAYGNVQSAATAWRAVRDPARGLELGRDLVDLWDELAAEDGPAAEDAEELEAARTRMGRLTERAARAQVG